MHAHYNTKIRRLAMASNELSRRAVPEPPLFRVALSREQQSALANFLPRCYSFQPLKLARVGEEEAVRAQAKQPKKKQNRELKDPDYSASYVAPLKEVGIVKTESLQAIPGGEAFNECFLILKRLKKSEFAWPFRVPVDPRSLGIPEYLNIVQEPMDLRTIEENLRKEEYAHPAEFHRDVYKIFMNSYKFNQKNSDVFATTSDFEDEYLRLVRDSKEGKLALQDKKSAKMETPPQDDPLSIKEEPKSVDHKPRPYHKRDKAQQEDKRRDKQEGVAREGVAREGEKEVKLEAEKGTDKIKDKEKEKEKEKERKLEKKLEKQRKLQKERVKIEQHSQPQSKPLDLFRSFQEKNEEQQLHHSVSEGHYDPHKEVYSQVRDEKQEGSHSNDPASKHRGKHTSQGKIRKHKEKSEFVETLKEIKELKEVSQFQNEKDVIVSSIQKRLTDLLKRLNDCQVPKTKGKNLPRPDQEQPNYNNFTSITAAEKKKLAERINLLPETDLHYVIEICFRHKRNKARDEAGVYDIDLDRLDAKVLKELSNFVASRTKWVRKSSKRETSQRQLSQAEEVEEEPENNPFFNEEAQLDNEDNQLRMYDPIGFEHNLLDDPEDSPPNIYQQPHFDFAHRDLLDMGIDNSDGQSYHPEQEDEGDIRY